MSKAARVHLPVVDDAGNLQYTSPSAMVKADPREGGCLRRWHFKYVGKRKEPSSAGSVLGDKCHEEVDRYLTTGENVLGPIAMRAKHCMPDPAQYGRTFESEWSISGDPQLSRTLLTVAGNIPVIGFVDVVKLDGLNVGGTDITDTHDPEGTVEILDWKFLGRMEYAKQSHEMSRQIPMICYGEAAARRWPSWVRHVRLSHVNTPTKAIAPARKATVLLDREQVARAWEQIDPVARMIRDVARETDSNRVEPNLKACGMYGGCPHRSYCTAGMHNSLEGMFGQTAAASLIASMTPPGSQQHVSNQPSFLASLAGFSPAGPTPPAPPVTASPTGVTADLAGGVAALMAEQARAAAPPAPVAPPPAPAPAAPVVDFAAFTAACEYIDRKGYGWPVVTGNAAAWCAARKGHAHNPGASYAGSGKLNALKAHAEPAEIVQLANDLRNYPDPVPDAQPAAAPVQPPAAPVGALPPDAPPSNPALASVPVAGYGAPVAPPVATPMSTSMAAPPPMQPAPAAPPMTAMQATIAAQAQPSGLASPPADKPKRGRGRPRKADASAPAGNPPGVPNSTSTDDGDSLDVYVNAIPSVPYESLNDYRDAMCAALCAHYSIDDIRLGGKETPLAFGGWRGAISAMVRERPPANGVYVIHTGGDEISDALAAALSGRDKSGEPICDLYVRGVRS